MSSHRIRDRDRKLLRLQSRPAPLLQSSLPPQTPGTPSQKQSVLGDDLTIDKDVKSLKEHLQSARERISVLSQSGLSSQLSKDQDYLDAINELLLPITHDHRYLPIATFLDQQKKLQKQVEELKDMVALLAGHVSKNVMATDKVAMSLLDINDRISEARDDIAECNEKVASLEDAILADGSSEASVARESSGATDLRQPQLDGKDEDVTEALLSPPSQSVETFPHYFYLHYLPDGVAKDQPRQDSAAIVRIVNRFLSFNNTTPSYLRVSNAQYAENGNIILLVADLMAFNEFMNILDHFSNLTLRGGYMPWARQPGTKTYIFQVDSVPRKWKDSTTLTPAGEWTLDKIQTIILTRYRPIQSMISSRMRWALGGMQRKEDSLLLCPIVFSIKDPDAALEFILSLPNLTIYLNFKLKSTVRMYTLSDETA